MNDMIHSGRTRNIPSFISLFFEYCRRLSFEEVPDYQYLYSVLSPLDIK